MLEASIRLTNEGKPCIILKCDVSKDSVESDMFASILSLLKENKTGTEFQVYTTEEVLDPSILLNEKWIEKAYVSDETRFDLSKLPDVLKNKYINLAIEFKEKDTDKQDQ